MRKGFILTLGSNTKSLKGRMIAFQSTTKLTQKSRKSYRATGLYKSKSLLHNWLITNYTSSDNTPNLIRAIRINEQRIHTCVDERVDGVRQVQEEGA